VSRPFLRALQFAATLALLALLWRVADGAAAVRHLTAAEPRWLLAALLALTAQTVLSALRWRLTAARLGIDLAPRRALAEYYLAQIVNQALPGGVLGDAGRALRARQQAGLVASGQAVLFERLAGQIALLGLFVAAVVGTTLVSGGFTWPAWLLDIVAPALAGVVLASAVVVLGVSRLPRTLGAGLAGVTAAFGHAVTAPPVRVRQALTSLGTALCNVAAFVCCAASVGVLLAPTTALVLVPLILFTMLIPATVSGWGLREGAAATLLPLAGATAAEGFAVGVAFGLAFLVATLPGLAFLLLPAEAVPTPAPDPGAREEPGP
jgi:uncharacterized membrane protein YbhN (UPF0104 family)